MLQKLTAIHWHLVLQPLLGVFYIACVLLLLDATAGSAILWAIGSGCLASSCYIVFITPRSVTAQPHRIVGGYIVGITVGVLTHLLLKWIKHHFSLDDGAITTSEHLFWISAALTVGIAMFIMVVLNIEHPPAVGLSLVLVLDIEHYGIILAILGAAMVLAILKKILNPWLVNLAIQRPIKSQETPPHA